MFLMLLTRVRNNVLRRILLVTLFPIFFVGMVFVTQVMSVAAFVWGSLKLHYINVIAAYSVFQVIWSE